MKPCAPVWPIWPREEERDDVPTGSGRECGPSAGLRGRQAESRYSRAIGTTYEDLRGVRRIRRRTELRVAGPGRMGTGRSLAGLRPPPVRTHRTAVCPVVDPL